MIDVAEHVYHDDPRIGPPDARTQLRDVCYYFLGNGLIQAAVQHAPGGEGTPYGLLLMNPQHLKMKREALSFDDTSGIASTMLSISFGETASPMEGCHINVRWDTDNGHPGVRIEWQTQALQVYELFCCPDRSTPRLLRKIRLHNSSSLPVRC